MPSTIPEGTHAAEGVRLTGTTFRDVYLGGATFDDVNWSGVANANVDGMTIDGVLVSELMTAYRAR